MAARVIAAMTSSREYKDVIWVVGRFIRVPPRLGGLGSNGTEIYGLAVKQSRRAYDDDPLSTPSAKAWIVPLAVALSPLIRI